jgi:hypothetical protein
VDAVHVWQLHTQATLSNSNSQCLCVHNSHCNVIVIATVCLLHASTLLTLHLPGCLLFPQ